MAYSIIVLLPNIIGRGSIDKFCSHETDHNIGNIRNVGLLPHGLLKKRRNSPHLSLGSYNILGNRNGAKSARQHYFSRAVEERHELELIAADEKQQPQQQSGAEGHDHPRRQQNAQLWLSKSPKL
eukprot:scaffold5451_cov174-Ochromonas_danica.AAC.4